MILKLNGADFSAENLGKIQVTTVLHSYTKAAISASGNESLTDAQKSALNELFLAMGVDGSNNVMSKMRKIYIPMIASDVSNALINYATNNFVKDFAPNASNWELRNLGIAQKADGQYFTNTLSSPLLATNFTQIFLRTENMVTGVADKCVSIVLRGKKDNTKWLAVEESSVSNNEMISWSENGFGGSSLNVNKLVEQRCAAGISCRGANDVSLQRYESYFSNSNATPIVDMSIETKQTLYVLGLNNQMAPHPYGFMLIGEAITDAEFKNIISKVNDLYNEMKNN